MSAAQRQPVAAAGSANASPKKRKAAAGDDLDDTAVDESEGDDDLSMGGGANSQGRGGGAGADEALSARDGGRPGSGGAGAGAGGAPEGTAKKTAWAKSTWKEDETTQLDVEGAIADSDLPPCDPASLDSSERAAFAAEVLFSPAAARARLKDMEAEVDEYIRNARFVLAQHKVFAPDEVVSLAEQKIEVVVRSVFVEPLATAAAAAAPTLSGADAAASSASAPAWSSSSTPSSSATAISDGNPLASPALLQRTYVTESATGQTVNHVRPHDVWQRAIPEMTFLDLLRLVDYDADTALVFLEMMLSAREAPVAGGGGALPPEVAQVESRLRCRQAFDEKPWGVDDESEFQLQYFKYRMQFPKIFKAMGGGAAGGGNRQPKSMREVIRHFHYVWKRPQSLNGGLVQTKRRRGRRGVDGIMRSLLPWHFDKRVAGGNFKSFMAGPTGQHVQKCPRCTFKNSSVDPLDRCRLCGRTFESVGNRRSTRRRKKNTARFDGGGGDDSEDDEDDDGFQLPPDDPTAGLERRPHRLFSSLPHPLLESFVEEFLAKVQVYLHNEPAGTQYNRHTKLDDFAQILNDYVDGSLPTSVAESALRELLDGVDDELILKDFDFLLRTVWHINIDRPQPAAPAAAADAE